MSQAVFTRESLLASTRANDARRFKFDWARSRDQILDAALALATSDALPAPAYRMVHTSSGKQAVDFEDYSTHLIHRTIATYLRRRFRVVIPKRDYVVRGVLESLEDTTPMWIIRRDIRSFYESVCTEALQERLLFDTAISSSVRRHLKAFFEEFSGNNRGLPRGAVLSSVLTELAMEPFDQETRATPCVYRYFRYSDDILLFTFSDPAPAISQLSQTCSDFGMSFNEQKSQEKSVCRRGKSSPGSPETHLEYLGYRFAFDDLCHQKRPRRVTVSISEGKIKRIKSRIIWSLQSFQEREDHLLLLDRLRYLSANFEVPDIRLRDPQDGNVLSGIYFNYKMCGIYDGARSEDHDCSELKALDGFYRSLLKSAHSQFRSTFEGLPPMVRARLLRISFYHGYRSRYVHRFAKGRLSQIKAAWRYAR